jgi:hypothetical protein
VERGAREAMRRIGEEGWREELGVGQMKCKM